MPEHIASGGFEPDLTMWDAWAPAEVARRFASVNAPWYIAGGWAVDLFLGGQQREHGDLEVGIPRHRFAEVAARLVGYAFFVPHDGLLWPLDQAGERFEDEHQTWVREPATGRWRLDIFREPSDGEMWIFRRDERIRMPYRHLIERTNDGIPYCRPEVALLFKAKQSELARNQQDLDSALPHFDSSRCHWLRESIALVHPGHPWLERLA